MVCLCTVRVIYRFIFNKDMLRHIVLLKLKEDTTEEQLEEMVENLKALKDKIPGIISVSAGRNSSPEDRDLGFNYCFLIDFENAEARNNYLPHPEHKKVGKEYVRPIAAEILVFDYETNELPEYQHI